MALSGRNLGIPGVNKDTVYSWISVKRMPAHRVGRLWKFKREEVDGWVMSGGAADHNNASPGGTQGT